jgi:tRNA uridine 5-carbamoylmethylation protein Kti12
MDWLVHHDDDDDDDDDDAMSTCRSSAVTSTGSSSSRTTVVVLMCGLPASGKSKLSKWLLSACCQEQEQQEVNGWDDVTHIEYDQVEDRLAAATGATGAIATDHPDDGMVNLDNNDNEHASYVRRNVWKTSRAMSLQVLNTKLHEEEPLRPSSSSSANSATSSSAVSRRRIIIMDDNFHLRSMRREVFRMCQSFVGTSALEKKEELVYLAIVWLDISKEVCLQRNMTRTRRVPPTVIDRMSITLEPPGKESWEQCYLPIRDQSTDPTTAILYDFVTRTCMKEYPPIVAPPSRLVEEEQALLLLEEARRKTRESWLHSWDQRLRSWVGMVAHISRKDTGAANKARKQVLQHLRQQQQQHSDGISTTNTNNASILHIISQRFLDEMNVSSSWTEEQLQRFVSSATIVEENA